MKRLDALDLLHIYRIVKGDIERSYTHNKESCLHCTNIRGFIASLLPVIEADDAPNFPSAKIILERCPHCGQFKGKSHRCPMSKESRP